MAILQAQFAEATVLTLKDLEHVNPVERSLYTIYVKVIL